MKGYNDIPFFEFSWDSFKYRNYDYAIGRFMSVDPLAEKYPWYSPYQFSGNKVIAFRELEGKEETAWTNYKQQYWASDRWVNKTWEEQQQELHNTGMMGLTGLAILGAEADIFLNQGRVLRTIGRYYFTQASVNGIVEAYNYFAHDQEFSLRKIFTTSWEGLDFADIGLDQAAQKLLGPQLNALEKTLTIVAPSLFDVTIKDGVQIVSLNKDFDKVIEDALGNTILESLDKAKIKISSTELKQSFTEILRQELTKNLDLLNGMLQNNNNGEEENKSNELENFLSPVHYDVKN